MRVLLAVVSLLALGSAYWAVQERSGRLAAEQRTSTTLAQPAPPPPATPAEPSIVKNPVSLARPDRSPKVQLPTEYIRIIEETRASLEAVRRELSTAKNEVAAAAARSVEEREQREKLIADLAEANEALASARRLAAATEADLRAKSERVIKLETSEKLVREAAGKAEGTSSRVLRTAQELEDLNRRRELVLTSIIRRYRDVTDQYRTLSLRVQNRAEQLGLDPGAGELSRIQTSVQQAEEEMRQLNGLNAQAAKLLRAVR